MEGGATSVAKSQASRAGRGKYGARWMWASSHPATSAPAVTTSCLRGAGGPAAPPLAPTPPEVPPLLCGTAGHKRGHEGGAPPAGCCRCCPCPPPVGQHTGISYCSCTVQILGSDTAVLFYYQRHTHAARLRYDYNDQIDQYSGAILV